MAADMYVSGETSAEVATKIVSTILNVLVQGTAMFYAAWLVVAAWNGWAVTFPFAGQVTLSSNPALAAGMLIVGVPVLWLASYLLAAVLTLVATTPFSLAAGGQHARRRHGR